MRDPKEQALEVDAADEDTTPDEIARALGSVWTRFSGVRPKSTSVEVDRDRVRCVIEEGTVDPEAASDGDGEALGEPQLSTDSPGFGYTAIAAVARVTGRRVVGFIPKADKKAETASQTFILDRPRRRY